MWRYKHISLTGTWLEWYTFAFFFSCQYPAKFVADPTQIAIAAQAIPYNAFALMSSGHRQLMGETAFVRQSKILILEYWRLHSFDRRSFCRKKIFSTPSFFQHSLWHAAIEITDSLSNLCWGQSYFAGWSWLCGWVDIIFCTESIKFLGCQSHYVMDDIRIRQSHLLPRD